MGIETAQPQTAITDVRRASAHPFRGMNRFAFSSRRMTVQSHPPCERLARFVRCYMMVGSEEGHLSTILPDTGMSIVFRYTGATHLSVEDGFESLPEAVVTGIRKSAAHIRYAPTAGSVIVLLREGGAAAFLQPGAQHFFDKSTALADVLPAQGVRDIVLRLAEAGTVLERVTIVESFLLSLLTPGVQDGVVTAAMDALRASHGQLNMATLAKSLYLSQDVFEKRFRRAVGATPKHIARIIRFRHVLQTHRAGQSLTAAAHAAAYFDQSHFIRDFRLFTGTAPSQFLGTPFW